MLTDLQKCQILVGVNANLKQTRLQNLAMRFIAVLLLACFAFSTVAEAAACSGEFQPEISHAASDLADKDHSDENDDTSEQHAVCAHGHCHHLAQVFTPAPSTNALKLSVSLFGPRRDNALPEANLSKLKRPPRV